MEDHVICSESITSSFQIWNPLISFSSLMAAAKTSKTMLNSSGESGHPCLVPDFTQLCRDPAVGVRNMEEA